MTVWVQWCHPQIRKLTQACGICIMDLVFSVGAMLTDVYTQCRLVPLLETGICRVLKVNGEPKRKIFKWAWAFIEIGKVQTTRESQVCLFSDQIVCLLKTYLKSIIMGVQMSHNSSGTDSWFLVSIVADTESFPQYSFPFHP